MILSQYRSHLVKFQPLIALILLCIGISLMSDKFLTVDNSWNVMRQISVNICISVGMTLVVLTGGIDLSVGSILALCGAIAAGLLKFGIEVPSNNLFIGFTLLGAILAGLIVGSLLGLFNGWTVTRFKVPPFVATLAMLTIARGLTMLYTKGFPISNLGDNFAYIGTGWFAGIPVPVWISAVVIAIAVVITQKTALGRYIYAIGGNESASKLSGINISKVKMTVYAIAGVLAAVGGIMVTSRLDSAQPNAGTSYELDSIAAVVIGGTSLSGGRFIGTVFLQFVKSHKLLSIYAVIAALLCAVAILGKGAYVVYCLGAIGFFMSIMFPTIFALGIDGIGEDTKPGSSWLIMSIVGGAILPYIMGTVIDKNHDNIQAGYIVPLVCFLFIIYFGLSGYKIRHKLE